MWGTETEGDKNKDEEKNYEGRESMCSLCWRCILAAPLGEHLTASCCPEVFERGFGGKLFTKSFSPMVRAAMPKATARMPSGGRPKCGKDAAPTERTPKRGNELYYILGNCKESFWGDLPAWAGGRANPGEREAARQSEERCRLSVVFARLSAETGKVKRTAL